MPEQQSRRANPVTPASFEAAMETPIFPFGNGGVDLSSALDAIPVGKFSRLTNAYFTPGQSRELTSRPGQTPLATVGTKHHSIARLNNPNASTYTRLWGVDTNLYLGQSGALGVAIDTGYSGNPLTLIPDRPPLSGDPWMIIADSLQMRKARFDGLVLPLGLPAPSVAASTAFEALYTIPIEAFDNGFTAYTVAGVTVPVLIYNAGYRSGFSLQVVSPAGTITFGPISPTTVVPLPFWVTKPLAVDLTTFGAGIAATDDDILHLDVRVRALTLAGQTPDSFLALRVYFVISPFTDGVVPGSSPTQNTDAYVYTVTGDLLNQVLSGQTGAPSAIPSTTTFNDVWVELGTFSAPLRRGDFSRVGVDGSKSWATVTGIVVHFEIVATSHLTFFLDDCYLFGGRALDSSQPGAVPYDYRYTHYDPRTGAESNPSPLQGTNDIALAPVVPPSGPLTTAQVTALINANKALQAALDAQKIPPAFNEGGG